MIKTSGGIIMKKLFKCMHCGNIVELLDESGVPIICCGEKMTELVPNTTDAATEKHVPVIEVSGREVVVKVGSVEHPMVEEHYIMWIILETTKGFHKFELKPFDKPVAEFYLLDEEQIICAYEYCNIHGLWKSK